MQLVVGGAALALVLLASACDDSGNVDAGDGKPSRGVKRGTLRVFSYSDADTLDPGIAYFALDFALFRGMVRELYSFDSRVEGEGSLQPVPDLADGPYRLSPDGRTYTFRIRRGVRYAPPVINLYDDIDFVFGTSYDFKDRFNGEPDYFAPKGERSIAQVVDGSKTVSVSLARDADGDPLNFVVQVLIVLSWPVLTAMPGVEGPEVDPDHLLYPVQAVTYYTVFDDIHAGFGLLRLDRSRKPAWYAYQQAVLAR
jgi:ABC-type transport system substrate-binding protein